MRSVATIAVIDDVVDTTNMMSAVLASFCGVVDVLTFNSGKEFLEAFKNQTFSIVFLDLFMPEMSGYEVCTAVRSIDPAIPIIAFTAYREERTAAMSRGFTDFMLKPITDFDALCQMVKRYTDARMAS
jgi:CheY-like chemotaxis protein